MCFRAFYYALAACATFLILIPCGYAQTPPTTSAAPAESATPPAPANPYYVTDIQAGKDAASGEKAMEAAISEGQRKAFVKLLQTLGYEDAETIASRFDDGAVGSAVSEMDVKGEKVSATHYQAVFAFKFRPEAVRAMLDGAGVADPAPTAGEWRNDYAQYRDQFDNQNQAQSKNLAVLPIFDDGNALQQWDAADNIWQRAWRSAAIASGKAVTPPADAPTLHPLFLDDVRNGVLAPEDRSRIKEGLAPFLPGKDVMVIALGEFSRAPGVSAGTIVLRVARVSPDFAPLFVESYAPAPGENMEGFVGRVVRASFDRMQLGSGSGSVYGNDVLTSPAPQEDAYVYNPANAGTGEAALKNPGYDVGCGAAPEQTLTLIAPVYDLKEWTEIENRLRAAPGVVFVQPNSLIPGNMRVTLVHRCGENLSRALEKSGIVYNAPAFTVTLAR
ncbi:MAG: hypothetical protein ABW189_05780 [Rickettsiales bacterium]